MREGELSNSDHEHMDAFLGQVLDAYKTGELSRTAAVGVLAHVIAAVDLDNYPEARRWFEEGAKLMKLPSMSA